MIASNLIDSELDLELSGPERPQWFAVYTNSCQERRVAEHCQVRDIEAFLPVYRSTRRWKNGCTVSLERPLFPGYVFTRVSQLHRVRVLELPGVVTIVGAGRQPIPLPDSDIQALRDGIDLMNVEPHPYLKVGERVKIRRGPFEGMAGILVRKKNALRVVLTVDLIMKSISVEIDEHDLEVVGHEAVNCSSHAPLHS
jgi:transcription antitermination factor NusG